MSNPENCKYSKEHEWVCSADGAFKVGITDYAQQELGDVVYVDLPEEGAEVHQGQSFMTIESVKAVSDIYAPVNGKIIAVNSALESNPELINDSAFDEGWIVSIEASDESQLDSLMGHGDYEKFIAELSK